MPSEDQDILAKISQLAGQINRHKNQKQAENNQSESQTGSGSYSHPSSYHTQASTSWRPARGAYSGRGRGYPRRGKPLQVHRNKTLVLNGGNTSAATESTDSDLGDAFAASTGLPPSSAWVTKTDRHLQLINPAIFEKQSQQRAKAIEETRILKLKQRDERERVKLSKHLQRLGKHSSTEFSSSNAPASASNYEITVQGIRFRVVKNGSKLMKIPGDENAAKATPKTTTVGGVRFYRSKNGNLYRSGIVKAQRRGGVAKKINEPCRAFSTTGSCLKGPKCRYIHDPSKVAICKDFLQKGTCTLGESCDLSHDLTPERTPACLHFAKGNCSNLKCRYSHVRVSPNALVCRPFGIYGYCEKGMNCEDRHVHECPDFSNTGVCNTKGCKLPHIHRASIIRKNTPRGEQPEEDGSSDLSSDEDQDEIDSDDVDSDDLNEEFFGDGAGEEDMEILTQQDFVHL